MAFDGQPQGRRRACAFDVASRSSKRPRGRRAHEADFSGGLAERDRDRSGQYGARLAAGKGYARAYRETRTERHVGDLSPGGRFSGTRTDRCGGVQGRLRPLLLPICRSHPAGSLRHRAAFEADLGPQRARASQRAYYELSRAHTRFDCRSALFARPPLSISGGRQLFDLRGTATFLPGHELTRRE